MSTDGRQRKLVIAGVGVLALVVVAGVAWAQITAVAAERVVAEAGARNAQVEFESISVWPNGVVHLEGVRLERGALRAVVASIEVDAAVLDTGLLAGDPTITRVEARGVKLTEAEADSPPASFGGAGESDIVASLKRLGGGQLPAIRVADIEFEVRDVDVSVGEVELLEDRLVARAVVAEGRPLDRFVSKPVEIAEVSVAPIDAVLRRDRQGVEVVEAAGLSLHTEVARLRRLMPSGDADDEATTTKAGWNARAHRLLNRAFFLASGGAERIGAIAPPRVQLRGSRITLADLAVEATDVEASWQREKSTYRVAANVAHRGKPRGRLGAEYVSPTSMARLTADGLDLSLLQLVKDVPLGGRIDGDVRMSRVEEEFRLRGRVASKDAAVKSKRLAEKPVVVSNLAFEFDAVYAPVADDLGEPTLGGHPTGGVRFTKPERIGKFEVTRGKLTAANLEADVRFGLFGLGSLPIWPARFDLHMTLPKTPAQAVFDVVPPQLLGELYGTKLAGTVAGTFAVEIPLQRASRMRWLVDEQLDGFEIVELPKSVDVRRLRGAMTAPIGNGEPCRLTVDIPAMRSEANPRGVASDAPPIEAKGCAPWKYAPLDGVSDWIHRGILTTEDRGFYHHDGFNKDEIRKSLERNIAEGRFARGASTISMQFVKNLFLSRDKQAARKLREAILVYFLETVVKVPKKRIMEVYLNVIEYGVGVYGIWAAAQHYFGKSPADLTLIEAAWIITVIPGPRARYPYFQRRKIPDEWWERIQNFLDEMYRQEKIDELDLLTARAQPPQFRDGSGAALNDRSSIRTQVTPLAQRMRAMREAGMEREAVVAWSRKRAR